MGQPVKLSDALVLDARLVGEAAERSIASQNAGRQRVKAQQATRPFPCAARHELSA